ncbi:isoprenoid synthase domain-containing protein [Hypoxylon sp. FL1284]|nr:isoprenoid synthase domain-containing protein [Hypoxylon sp. FL1284]
MEYLYSEEVGLDLYETHGLARGEIQGAIRAQQDWSKYVNPVDGYNGGLGDPFSFIRVTVLECLPDRLEIVSYANEYAFLYDDEMEKLDLQISRSENLDFLETFGSTALSQEVTTNTRPEKRLQAQILAEMLAIDPTRAVTSMKAWASFVQSATKARESRFETLESYIPARVIDAGELIWYGTLTFGMALTICNEEHQLCMELAKPGYIVLGLTNDLFSWEKERKEAAEAGQDHVFNAIWVIMKERSVGEAEAKAFCSDQIQKYMREFCEVVERTQKDLTLSKDLRVYIEAVKLSCVGNLVWSIYCPRYQKR